MVATEDDRDGAGRGHLADLAVDHRVAALDPGRDDVRVAGVDDGQDVERRRRRAGASGSSPTCTAPRGSPAARTARPDRWVTASSNGAPTIATSTAAPTKLGRVGDPRQVHERRGPDVGRQVEVVVGLEVAVPAVVAREVAVGWGRAGAQPRDPPETVATSGRADRVRLAGGAAGSNRRPAGRATRIVALTTAGGDGGPFARCRLRALAHAPWVRSLTCSPPPCD